MAGEDMYSWDTTGDGYDILKDAEVIFHVGDIETAKGICELLNKAREKEDCPRDCPILYGSQFVICIHCGRSPRNM